VSAFETSIVAQLRLNYRIPDSSHRELLPTLSQVAQRLNSGQQQLIILDGLDEAFGPLAQGGNPRTLLDHLPRSKYLPQGIFFLVIIPSGTYVFVCDLWETIAITPGIQLIALAWDLNNHRPAPNLSAQLLTLLSQAEPNVASGVSSGEGI
jgi:hypothetical protein